MNVEHDSSVKVNWFTLNVPTLVVIVGAVIHYTSTNAAQDASIEKVRIQQEADTKALNLLVDGLRQSMIVRDDSLNKSRELTRAEYDKKIAPLLEGNVLFRLAQLEAADTAINDRIDRISSSMGQIRDATSEIKTNVALVGQTVDQIVGRLDRIFPDGAPQPRRP